MCEYVCMYVVSERALRPGNDTLGRVCCGSKCSNRQSRANYRHRLTAGSLVICSKTICTLRVHTANVLYEKKRVCERVCVRLYMYVSGYLYTHTANEWVAINVK